MDCTPVVAFINRDPDEDAGRPPRERLGERRRKAVEYARENVRRRLHLVLAIGRERIVRQGPTPLGPDFSAGRLEGSGEPNRRAVEDERWRLSLRGVTRGRERVIAPRGTLTRDWGWLDARQGVPVGSRSHRRANRSRSPHAG